MMSTLKVGMVRYGVMCGVDGMVIDDGTVMRLAEDRFLVTTTTGGAAKILDWMEEWLQTEWPHLRVRLHLGHRAVGHLPRRRARSRATCSARCSPTSTSATTRSRSWRGATRPSTGCHVAGRAGSASPANWPTRSTSPAWHAPAVWER